MAALVTKNKRVGMIATAASVRSGAYERTLRALDPAVTVIQKACPLFVPLAEEGRTRPGDLVIETVAEEYLASLREEGIDTLILGCTHYPLLKDVIANVMGPGVALIDSGEESAKELQRLLTASDSLGEPQGGGAIYCVSDRVEDFEQTASLFLQEDLRLMKEAQQNQTSVVFETRFFSFLSSFCNTKDVLASSRGNV